MSFRPQRPLSEHPGFHYEAAVDALGWVCPPIGAGRCRWREKRVACKRPAVATLIRGSHRRAYDYCERHLYGRWIEGGKVMSWRVVPDREG
jgi:hypothetical protein